MRRKIRAQLTTNRVMVLVIAVLFALAWAVPSIGASAGKVARVALARSNQAVHDSNVAVATSNTAKSTSNTANSTAAAANSTANAANTTANSAKTTANQALTLANGAAHVQDNFTRSSDPGNISAGTCTTDSFIRFGVLSTDEVIVTPPDTQPNGIITQAYTSNGGISLEFCNVSNNTIDPPPGSYEYSTIN
jgi:hypothetical protein